MSNPYHITEYGTIRSKSDYEGGDSMRLDELYLPQKEFEELLDFIIYNQESGRDGERIFSISKKGKKRQISTKNYVGVIETKNGVRLEILPKFFKASKNYEEDLEKTRRVFLIMLKRLKNSPFKSIGSAHLKTTHNFPLLEIFIENYINEVQKLILKGLKSNYVPVEENLSLIRGKILSSENMRFNHSNRAKFYCLYDLYSLNIVQNKLIKSTLLKLNLVSRRHRNRSNIIKLLAQLDNVEPSNDPKQDLLKAKEGNRLFQDYDTLIKWSNIFLNDLSFTNFSGESKNLAIFFPMERIFEDYVGYLFKKHVEGYEIKTQDKTYYLVEDHRENGKFKLKPDIVAKHSVNSSQIIIDTKWKLIDQNNEKKNYNISQADMYQLYAYGKKYALNSENSIVPNLVIIYPKSDQFNEPLDDFIYEGDLILNIMPFDLQCAINTDLEKDEVNRIIEKSRKINTYKLFESRIGIAAEPKTEYVVKKNI